MKIVIFGATGMVGQSVLRASLLDPGIESVLTVGRSAVAVTAAKWTHLLHGDFLNFAAVSRELTGYDACFWCLGVTSAGMNEADYSKVTVDYALAAAAVLVKANPGMTFVFVSGAGTDATESGGTMWARVKGRAENALQKLPFKAVYAFRPGFIQPMHGVASKTRSYRIVYALARPLFPLLRLFPAYVVTSDQLAGAMLRAARDGAPKRVLESADIARLAAG